MSNRPYVRKADLERLRQIDPKLKPDAEGYYTLFKVTSSDRSPPCYTKPIRYEDGRVVAVRGVSRDPERGCGPGLNVLTHRPYRRYAKQDMPNAGTLLKVRVHQNDIGCVPYFGYFAGSHKIRVRRLTVVGPTRWKSLRS